MSELKILWDPQKSRTQRKTHGVSFEEAQAGCSDEHATLFFDEKHSDAEERFLLLGLSHKLRLLLVCHCYRESESVIRIISARQATQSESTHYTRS